MPKKEKAKRVWQKILAVLLCFALLIAVYRGCVFAVSLVKVRNVFDEMYYGVQRFPANQLTGARPENVPPILSGRDTSLRYAYEGVMMFEYSDFWKERLIGKENIDISFSVYFEERYFEEKIIIYTFVVDYNEFLLIMHCHYYLNTRALEYEPLYLALPLGSGITQDNRFIEDGAEIAAYFNESGITKQEIDEWKHYFVWERVVYDWTQGNGKLSRFTPENPGKYVLEDMSYDHLEEWNAAPE